MKNTPYAGRYINKSQDFQVLITKWLCINPAIRDGDLIQNKTILLNLAKINRCVFYPIKDNITVDGCNFIGKKEDLKGELLNRFDLMIYRDELSVTV